jgi:hypothetical protein
MAVKQQFTVALENKKGQLARLCRVLQRAKVNIDAISVADSSDCGIVRLIADSTAKARKALRDAGMNPVISNVVVADLPNAPGALAKAAAAIAKAGVNIDYVYGSTQSGAETALCVFACDDPQKADGALG